MRAMRVPFFLRRPWLLARDLLVDRDEPPLESLERLDDPERFVWAVLPHAARTFSACIALLPQRSARAAAVAYLYCRTLDTYEDLMTPRAQREAALEAFARRFTVDSGGAEGPRLAPAPDIGADRARDQRDRAHLLLVRHHARVDAVWRRLDPVARRLIADLVGDMSADMRWASQTFHRQGGVLEDEEQLARYCRGVLGHPVVFASRLTRWNRGLPSELSPEVREDAMRVGEMIQLANVTRDIEKDLERGVAYHPGLRDDLGRAAGAALGGDADLQRRVRGARRELLRLALVRAPAYRRLIEWLSPGRVSAARASGVLMLMFTDRYYRGCAVRAGLEPWAGPRSGIRLILSALPAIWSPRWAARRMARIERAFLTAAA